MRNAIHRAAFAALALSLACLAPAVHAQSKDPIMGTWKLNLEKSKYNPGPPPKSLVLKFEPAGKATRNTTEFVNAQGKSFTIGYTAPDDGKDHPLTGSPSGANTVSLKRLPDGRVERTDKKDGQVIQTMLRQISGDGKTLTVTQKAKTAEGAPVENLLVFDKQ